MGYVECTKQFSNLGYEFKVGDMFEIIDDRYGVVTIETPIGKIKLTYEVIQDGLSFRWANNVSH